MKTQIRLGGSLLALLMTVTSFTACEKPVAETETEREVPATPSATPAAAVVLAAPTTPPPAPVPPPAVVAVATPQPPQIAPSGVYFLLVGTSIETDAGLIGLKPGTRLQQTAPGQYTVNGKSVSLSETQVTNDLRIAKEAESADAATQAALRQAALAQRVRQAQAQYPIAAPQPESAAPATPAPFVPGTTSLDANRPASALDKTHSNTKDRVYHDYRGVPYWKDARGRHRYDF